MPRLSSLFAFGTALVLLATLLCLAGFIGVPALCWVYALAVVALIGVLLLGDRDPGVRATGAAFLGFAALVGALAVGVAPAHAAEAAGIAPPPNDTGLWSWLNPYFEEGVGTAAAAAVSWAGAMIGSHTRIKIRADQEAQVRETLKTALYAGAHELELRIGERWTPAQQAALVKRMRDWAEMRAAAQLRRLGLPNFVVEAMAHKVLGEVTASAGFDLDAAAAALPPGNPGETPLLARLGSGV